MRTRWHWVGFRSAARLPCIALCLGLAGVAAAQPAATLEFRSLSLLWSEDKRLVFHADDTLAGALSAMEALLRGLTFDPPAPSADTASLDLAERLVRRGVPFREAHEIVGRVVQRMEAGRRGMESVIDNDLEALDTRFEPGDAAALDPESSVQARRVTDRVTAQIAELRSLLD